MSCRCKTTSLRFNNKEDSLTKEDSRELNVLFSIQRVRSADAGRVEKGNRLPTAKVSSICAL